MTIWRGGWRSGAREAPRHVGYVYDRGYQFKYPDRAMLTMGPWDSVWPLAGKALPRNVLRSVKDGALIDGVIMPLWERIENTVVNKTVLGAVELPVGDENYRLIFIKNGTQLQVSFTNGAGNSGTHTYAVNPGTGTITATAWQNVVYFTSPTLGSVRSYIPSTGVFASVVNSPTNGKFIFMLDNNLVVVRDAGTIFETVWTVDSDPMNWTGSGSGTNPLYKIGTVRGVGVFSDRAIIVGSGGAKVMIPMGNAVVPFAFKDVKAIDGTPFDYGVAFSQNALFYIGYDRQLRMFANEAVQVAGQGEGILRGNLKTFYSDRLGYVIVSSPEEGVVLFLDPDTGQWVSDLDVVWDFVTDSPQVGELGYVYGLRNSGSDYVQHTMNLEPVAYTLPRIRFGAIDLNGEEWTIEYIDVRRTHADSPVPLTATITRHLISDTVDQDIFDADNLTHILEKGRIIRYFLNRPAVSLDIEMEVASLSAAFLSGPYLIAEMNAAGNIPVNPTNEPSGWLGDLRVADGNMDILASSTQYAGSGSLNSDGNLLLVPVGQTNWLPNTGIDQINIAIKKQTLQPQRAQ